MFEEILEGLKELKKNENSYNSAKESAKLLVGKYKQLQGDKEFPAVITYAVSKLGQERVSLTLENYFKPKPSKFAELLEGIQQNAESNNLDYLLLSLYSQIKRSDLAHRVYVISRTSIREGVTFSKDEPKEDGTMPKHRTMTVTLWDADLKKIISLFIVDGQIEAHASLETGKAYRMQIGNYNSTSERWYPSNQPSIVQLEDFHLDEMELAKYILSNYEVLKPPYDEAIEYTKTHPGKQYVLYAKYFKFPGRIDLMPGDGVTITLPFSSMTANLPDEGEVIVLGAIRKTKVVEGQPTVNDYIIFPDIVISTTEEGEESKTTENNKSESNDNELDNLLNGD